MQDNYSLVYDCNKRVTAWWKTFVEYETLVALNEALYYLAISKLENYDIYVKHYIKLAFKLQSQTVDDILILLSWVKPLWKHRNWEILRNRMPAKLVMVGWQGSN